MVLLRRGWGLAMALVTGLACVAAVGIPVFGEVAQAATARVPAPPPAPAGPRQRITVTAAGYDGTTYATLRVYQLTAGGTWAEVMGPWTARVGYNGVARPGAKREGDGTTPSGSYGFGSFFGVDPDPGARFPWRHGQFSDCSVLFDTSELRFYVADMPVTLSSRWGGRMT